MTVLSLKMFDKLLGKRILYEICLNIYIFLTDKATSPLLLEPDWKSILQLCDIVKTQEIP